jgi:hypothetical protein
MKKLAQIILLITILGLNVNSQDIKGTYYLIDQKIDYDLCYFECYIGDSLYNCFSIIDGIDWERPYIFRNDTLIQFLSENTKVKFTTEFKNDSLILRNAINPEICTRFRKIKGVNPQDFYQAFKTNDSLLINEFFQKYFERYEKYYLNTVTDNKRLLRVKDYYKERYK